MKISDDRGKISDPAGKRDISEISDSTGRYVFPWSRLSKRKTRGSASRAREEDD
jgi:hypothetical protein